MVDESPDPGAERFSPDDIPEAFKAVLLEILNSELDVPAERQAISELARRARAACKDHSLAAAALARTCAAFGIEAWSVPSDLEEHSVSNEDAAQIEQFCKSLYEKASDLGSRYDELRRMLSLADLQDLATADMRGRHGSNGMSSRLLRQSRRTLRTCHASRRQAAAKLK
jgi:hypothetical protein